MRPSVLAASALAALLGIPAAAAAADQGRPAGVAALIDSVMADPRDASAHAELDAAARRAAGARRAAAEAERVRLLKAAREAQEGLESMMEAKKKRLRAWERDFSEACSMASDPDRVRGAVEAYEALLKDFPVYSDTAPLLDSSDRKIMGVFYRTIKRSYPYLALGRDTADTRMLAALVFSRDSELHAEYGGLPFSGAAEAQLKKAEKITALKAVLERQLRNMSEGLSLYSRGRWTGSAAYFARVLSFDAGDEEALYYHSLALKKAGAGKSER